MNIIAVIATKNRFQLLKKAVESVYSQTVKVDDLIVVSDSEEDSYLLEKKFLEKYPCNFIRDIYTRNYAGNLNSAIEFLISQKFNSIDCNNTYIAFLDDDDTWECNYIEECSRYLPDFDFVVSGLKYQNEKGESYLPMPNEDLTIQSFLKGNPGIQGSNTFIRFSTLLKAGCFDENMSSTTDRDLFTRVMMLGVSYKIVDKYLVNVEVSNSRVRITNSSNIKYDGLAKFYYKYRDIMSDKTKEAFFDRAEKLFNLTEEKLLTLIELNEDFSDDIPLIDTDNVYKGLIASRKALIDKVYAKVGQTPAKRQSSTIINCILESSFDNYSSNTFIETPLFNYSNNCYNKALMMPTNIESNFNSLYKKYIGIEDASAYSWLQSIALKVVDDKLYSSIIVNAIMEVYFRYGTNENRVFNYDKYVSIARRLLAKYIMHSYRINGLSEIDSKQTIDFVFEKNKVDKIFDEIEIKGTFDYIRKELEIGKTKQLFSEKEKEIKECLCLDNITILGYGSEGCVFTDYKKIYKWFNSFKEELYVYLNEISSSLSDSQYFYQFKPFIKNSNLFISYDYIKSEPLNKTISYNDLEEFIDAIKGKGFVVDNVKKDNFRLDSTGIKYIDYGFSIKKYDKSGYEKSKIRAKQMIDNFDNDELFFYKLINKYYIERETE